MPLRCIQLFVVLRLFVVPNVDESASTMKEVRTTHANAVACCGDGIATTESMKTSRLSSSAPIATAKSFGQNRITGMVPIALFAEVRV